MKRTVAFAAALLLVLSLILPAGAAAADGELLVGVNFLTDTFHNEHYFTNGEYAFSEKFDMSATTADSLIVSKKEGITDEVWKNAIWYVEDSGYYVTEDTKYTMYFEVATPHNTKYSGIPFLHEPEEDTGIYAMIWGAFSDNGDNKDSDGKQWSECRYVYCYGEMKYLLGTGYNSNSLSYWHPALTVEPANDTCTATPVTEVKYSTMKVEFNGLLVTTFYLDENNSWVRLENDGQPMEYETVFGSEIILGTYTRDQERHNFIRNLKLLQGTGLSYDAILNAKQTTAPKPEKPVAATEPVTEPAKTEPVVTEPAKTEPVATEPAATEGAGTDAQTDAPSTTDEKKTGCGSFLAVMPVTAALAAAAFCLRKKED